MTPCIFAFSSHNRGMYQTIGETIKVAGVFGSAKFTPKKFEWRTQIYQISQITLVNDVKDGGIKKRWYSVMAGANLYRLCFNRDNESWSLEEVWCE